MKHKMHAEYKLPYATVTTWAQCGRHVEPNQIAAFRQGVTCKSCIAALEWDEERARERAERASK